jgi:prepilin-type processing-associated H-X9-DG protein
LDLATKKHHVVAGAKLDEEAVRQLLDDVEANRRGAARALRPLLALRAAAVSVDLAKESRADLYFEFADQAKAKRGIGALQDGLTLVRLFGLGALLANLEDKAADADDPQSEEKILVWLQFLENIGEALRSHKIEQRGDLVHLSVRADTDLAVLRGGAKEIVKERQQDPEAVQARLRRKAANNLKQIGLALHTYHDVHKRFPPVAICSPDGNPLLSWRVAILPYVEQDALFRQFRLTESWDSPHNIKLLAQMPRIYAPVGVKTKEAHATFLQGFIGMGLDRANETAWGLLDPKRPFGPPPLQGRRIHEFQDGTFNTILVVEAGEAVPWSKPADIPYDAKKPLAPLGGNFKGGFHILFADGSVRFVRQFDETTLRNMITPRDGLAVDHERLR